MIELYISQNNNSQSDAYGKYYPRVSYKQTMNIHDMAVHMAEHNTPFSEGTIEGILRDFVKCVREQTLNGNTVKVDNLAIFKVSVIGNGCKELYDADTDKTITASIGSLAKTDKAAAEIAAAKAAAQGGGSQNQNGNGGSSTGSETAHGYALTISTSGSGSVSVTKDGNAVTSGANLNEDDEVAISITPAAGQVPTATINGSSIELTESDGVYTGNFAMPAQASTLVINTGSTSGGGSGSDGLDMG